MDAHEDNLSDRTQILEDSVEPGDVKAFLSQMLYACKRLKTTIISDEQIRDNWEPRFGRPSKPELDVYLRAALASNQINLIGGKYTFPEGSEEALTLNPPNIRTGFLGEAFNHRRAERSTRIYLGRANPRDYK